MTEHKKPLQQDVDGIQINEHPSKDFREISESTLSRVVLSAENESLKSQIEEARINAVTGLPNRQVFDEEFPRALRRHPGNTGLMVIDIDGLKRANDNLGHSQGDRLLKAFAHTMKSQLRVEDNIYHIGGDEFVVILNSAYSPMQTDSIGETSRRLEKLFESTLRDEDFPEELKLGASIGYGVHKKAEDPAAFFDRVDSSMFDRKEARKNHSGSDFIDIRQSPPANNS